MRLLIAAEKEWGRPLAALLHQHLTDAAIITATDLDSFIDRVTGEVYDLAAVELGFGGDQSRVVWDLLPGTSCILLVPPERAAEIRNLTVLPADDFVIVDQDLTKLAVELATRTKLGHRRQHSYYSLRQRYEEITQSLTEIIYQLDPEGKFVYLNRSVELLGYTPDELLGRHFTEILAPESARQSSRENVLKTLQGVATGAIDAPGLFDERRRGRRKTVDLEVRLLSRHVGGSGLVVGSVTATGEITRDIDGSQQFVGTLGVIQDITLRRRSEDSLRKLYAIAEEVPAAVLVTDRQLQVEYANPRFYRTFGVAPEYVISQKLSDIPATGFNAALVSGIERACGTGETWRATLLAAAETGRTHAIVARPVSDGSGQCNGLVLVIADVVSGHGSTADYGQPATTNRAETDEGTAAVSTIVHEALRRFESECPGSAMVLHPRIPEGMPPLSWTMAGFLQRLISDILSFAVSATGGGTCSLSVGSGDNGDIDLLVQGSRDGRMVEVTRDPADLLRVHSLADRVEDTRRSIVSAGGCWDMRRSRGGIEFRITVSGSLADSQVAPSARSIQTRRSDSHQTSTDASDPLYDIQEFARSYVGSEDVLREILAIYVAEIPPKLTDLEQALQNGDFGQIGRIAHSLVNTSGALQSSEAVTEAHALEAAARVKNITNSRKAADRLTPIISAILKAISGLDP